MVKLTIDGKEVFAPEESPLFQGHCSKIERILCRISRRNYNP
jgi:hypothetical protein